MTRRPKLARARRSVSFASVRQRRTGPSLTLDVVPERTPEQSEDDACQQRAPGNLVSSLPRRYSRNTLSNLGAAAVSVAIAVVTIPIMVHHLGTSRYGVWAVVASTVLYLELLELGLGGATVKYVAEFWERRDDTGLTRVVSTAFWALLPAGAVALLITAVLAVLVPHVLPIPPDLTSESRQLIALLGFDLACSLPMDVFGGVLFGLHRLDLLNLSVSLTAITQAIGWVAVLSAGGGLVALGVVTLIISLLGQLSRAVMVYRLLPGTSVRRVYADKAILSRFRRLSGWMALGDLNNVVSARLDPIVVGGVVGLAAAGVYSVGQRLASLATRATTPVVSAFFPHASALGAADDAQGLRSTLVLATRISAAVSLPVAVVVAWLAGPLLHVWVGEGFHGAVAVAVLLTVALTIGALGTPGAMILEGVGQPRLSALAAAMETCVNISLSVLLGIRYGLVGVAAATVVASSLVHLVFLLPATCRRLGVPWSSLYGHLCKAHLPAVAAASCVALVTGAAHGDTLGGVLWAAPLMLAVYVMVFLWTGVDRRERTMARERFLRRGKRLLLRDRSLA